jgi:rhamnogalacturonyl hydrolase YesR
MIASERMPGDRKIIEASLNKLQVWLEDNHYRGYDPADGLTSFLRPLTFGSLFLDRVLEQLVWKSPLNLRPIFGVKKLDSCIGRGYIARGYLALFRLTGEDSYRQKAASCLEWLIKNRAPGYKEFCWGKMFDFASRSGWQRRYEPITIWTGLIGLAYLDAYELTREPDYLAVAKSVCEWILKVPRTRTSSGACINYTPLRQGPEWIHNQSMVAAAVLARTAKFSPSNDFLQVAREAVEFTCSRQLADGSWYYGENPTYHWIDNFHTGYVLDSLKIYIELTGDDTYAPQLKLGYAFFKKNFIEEDGRPRYFHNKTFPVDSQCAAQAIDTLSFFSDYDSAASGLAFRVAKWTIHHMQDESGYFYFMRYPHFVLKPPMIHWAQATTLKALAHLLSVM